MTDLDTALFDAWHRVAPTLLDDPAELARRLARRQNKLFSRPLRAFCIAVRSNDNRINDHDAVIVPRTAISLDSLEHPGRYAPHQVTLDKPLLQRLCAPVTIDAPGEPADHVARKLGCRPQALQQIRRNGLVRTDPKPRLMGRPGKPVPRIFSSLLLDPQGRGRAGADEIFACSWVHNVSSLPDDFTCTLQRIPKYRRLHQRQGEQFIGWHWLCPVCGQTARTLFHPAGQPDFPTLLGFAPAKSQPLPKPPARFACDACHGVLHFSRIHLSHDWNRLILRITGGLLFGHEVTKPDWLKPQHRYGPRAPRPATPAPLRDRIQHLMVTTDLLYREIAAQLGLKHSTVARKACTILQRHNVHTRAELQSLLRQATAPAARAG